MSGSPVDVVVVGAGFSGLALCNALLKRIPTLRVAQFGEAEHFGTGYAYGPVAGDFLLNSRADQMGFDADAPAGFADWLGLEGEARSGFQPRAVYGRYLHDAQRRLAAQYGPRLQQQPHRLLAATHDEDLWRLRDERGAEIRCHQLILACGALPARMLPQIANAGLGTHPAFIAEPLRNGALEGIDPTGTALIVGTGPTMIDTALALLDRGHRGEMLALSRHGLIPRPHANGAPGPAQALPEMAEVNTRETLHALREHIDAGDDWRPWLDGLRPRLPALWRRADTSQRRRFLRHVAAYWSVHRHRLPPAQWQRLKPALDSGQLQIRAGRLAQVFDAGSTLRATLRWRGGGQHTLTASALVQTTGFGQHLSDNPLLADLLEGGHLRSDPLGLGAETDDQGRAIGRNGHAVNGLYLLGALTRGEAWDITAAPELRQAATRLANHLSTDT